MISEEVEVAAGELDEFYPGWWKQIDVWQLDMNSFGLCICGQVAMATVGDLTFWDVASKVSRRNRIPSLHVFSSNEDYRDQWIELIQDRREVEERVVAMRRAYDAFSVRV